MNQVVIEEEKLQHNIDIILEKAKTHIDDNGNPLTVIAVLKGNAYGMGAELVAKRLVERGVDYFAVTEVEEAIALRKQGIEQSILVLNATSIEEEAEQIVEYHLIATIGSKQSADVLNEAAKKKHSTVKCHLKIDTGFGRFGFRASSDIGTIVKQALEQNHQLQVVGTYSHFQESYAKDDKRTRQQLDVFLNAVANLKQEKIETGILHICNSAAFFRYPEMWLNAVRIGSAFSGRLQIEQPTDLQRVGYLESSVCEIRNGQAGDLIGYSGTCQLKRNTKIAIVEAGYADGFGVTGPKDSVRIIDKLRALKKDLVALRRDGTRYVEIDGKAYPVLGRIGMKNCMVDVTDSQVQVGDRAKIDINLVLANQKVERIVREK